MGTEIIDGENERIRNGGSPIYNPTIAKVQVHFEVLVQVQSKAVSGHYHPQLGGTREAT